MTLEEFYEAHPLGFVLFFERALMGQHKYKQAIVSGWMETCTDLRFSRIACGLVDMVSDRAYAERYIDPKTAPAHIVVRNSEPVMAMKEQIEGLLAKPGDKATMMAHVADLLKEEGSLGSLTLSVQVSSKEALQQLLRRHAVVIVAFTGEEKRLAETFRAAVQEAVLSHWLETYVGGRPKEGRAGKGRNASKEKWRIAFVVAHGKGLGAHLGVPDGERSIGAFVSGALRPGVLPIKLDAKPGDSEVLKAVRKVTAEAGLRAAADGSEESVQRRGKGGSEL
jgi:hypothetical protein